MQNSPSSSPTGNVEILDVRPVARQSPPTDVLAQVQGIVSEMHKQNLQVIASAVQQVSAHAVRTTLDQSHSTIVGTLHAIGILLAVRFILLLSLVGAFALAVMAMQHPTYEAIGIFVSFVALTVIPLVWLDRNGRRKTTEQ